MYWFDCERLPKQISCNPITATVPSLIARHGKMTVMSAMPLSVCLSPLSFFWGDFVRIICLLYMLQLYNMWSQGGLGSRRNLTVVVGSMNHKSFVGFPRRSVGTKSTHTSQQRYTPTIITASRNLKTKALVLYRPLVVPVSFIPFLFISRII